MCRSRTLKSFFSGSNPKSTMLDNSRRQLNIIHFASLQEWLGLFRLAMLAFSGDWRSGFAFYCLVHYRPMFGGILIYNNCKSGDVIKCNEMNNVQACRCVLHKVGWLQDFILTPLSVQHSHKESNLLSDPIHPILLFPIIDVLSICPTP